MEINGIITMFGNAISTLGEIIPKFYSSSAIAIYIFCFGAYTVYRLLLRPLTGAGSSDRVKAKIPRKGDE